MIQKDQLPNTLQKALRAQQAASNLDEHWESVYHSMYPVFMNEDDFHFSVNIGTDQRVDNYTITALLAFLTEAEVAVRFTQEIDAFGIENFQQFVTSIAHADNLNLSTKASFMSPGEVWGNITNLGPKWFAFYMLYSAMFGNSVIGWDGLIDLETRHMLLQVVQERWTEKSGDIISEKLKIHIPNVDTKILESTELDEVEDDET